MNKNKIVLASALAIVGILVVSFFLRENADIVDISVNEYFEGIRWDTSHDEAKNTLKDKGYTIHKNKVQNGFSVYSFNDINHINNADGKILIKSDENNLVNTILISFDENMDDKLLETLAFSYVKAFSQHIDKCVTKEDLNKKSEKAVTEYDICTSWIGDDSLITLNYAEAEKLTITYEPADTEYAKYLIDTFY